jgi:ankyrin repeat protein
VDTIIEIKDKDNWTPLHWAAHKGHVDVIRLLLEKGANVNAQDKDRWTPLHWPAVRRDVDVVRLLLEKGANVNAQEKDGWTPLHLEASGGMLMWLDCCWRKVQM